MFLYWSMNSAGIHVSLHGYLTFKGIANRQPFKFAEF